MALRATRARTSRSGRRSRTARASRCRPASCACRRCTTTATGGGRTCSATPPRSRSPATTRCAWASAKPARASSRTPYCASGGLSPPKARSPLKRVRDLREELSRGALQRLLLVQRALVAVAQEKRGLPVQPVAEQEGSRELAALRRDLERVERGIALRRHVLADRTQERA